MTQNKSIRAGLYGLLLTASTLGLAACATAPHTTADTSAMPAPARTTAAAEADRYAMEAILAGDYATAEARLRDAERFAPGDPYRLINLAMVLQSTGRANEAAALYRRVLEMDINPLGALPSGKGRPVKSIAKSALASLEQPD